MWGKWGGGGSEKTREQFTVMSLKVDFRSMRR